MKSVMRHSFAQTPQAEIPRSTFNLSHGVKTTFDADKLIPLPPIDVIPGDTFNVRMSHLVRLATPLHPLMDNLYVDVFWFFTPYRILWEHWTEFCGAQEDPGDSIDYTVPVLTGLNAYTGEGSVWDYFGLPIDDSGAHFDPDDVSVSAMPFRALGRIWNDWFRDENLQDSLKTPTDDGPDTLDIVSGCQSNSDRALAITPTRGKRHDYFTSCLPWPQKGDAVDLPLGTSAPIVFDGANNDNIIINDDTGADGAANWQLDTDGTAGGQVVADGPTSSIYSNVYTDLSGATAATINDIRLAFQTQRLLERDARSGTRYVETLHAHWGISNYPDARLQRPEYLGGGSSPMGITPVPNTSDTTGADQGDLAGYGVATGSNGFTKSFVEHGVIIGLINARSDITYSQGIDRYWSKSTRYDFYYPVLSQLGEQSVLNKEIWADGSANDDLVFGYTERYNEYRFINSRLTGLMRPDAAGTLASWHLSEDFATLPTLGSTFIESNTGTPLDRAIAVPSEPQFIGDFYLDIKAARPLPLHGVPGNLDHF